jgi:hypothetical protein
VLGGPLHTVPLQMQSQINQFGVRSNTNSMFTILPNQNKAPLNAQPNLIRGDLNRAQFGVPQSAPIVRTLGSSPCIRLESANQSVRSSQIVGGQNLNHIPSFSSQPLVKFAPPLPPRPAQGPLNTNVRVGGQPVLGWEPGPIPSSTIWSPNCGRKAKYPSVDSSGSKSTY